MNPRYFSYFKAMLVVALCLGAGAGGYVLGLSRISHHPPLVCAAPHAVAGRNEHGGLVGTSPGSVRVIYSLDAKRNDKELISLIAAAKDHVYFAIYEFTLTDVADALVAAKQRGVDVRGLVDAGESKNSYDAPIMAKLQRAGIPLETERHPNGNGIMHIKALVTESAYAMGSFNWTVSATRMNDELLEIGTDPMLVKRYESLLLRLLKKYRGSSAPLAAVPVSHHTYRYLQAPQHIGEYASVRGTLYNIYTSTRGTVFLDFCRNHRTCPFSVVIFADDAKKFGDLSPYLGKSITLTGAISSYRGRAEIKLSDPSQIAQ